MTGAFAISPEWTDFGGGAPVDLTSALLRVEVAGHVATRAENAWSRTLQEAPHLSALPLARWLAHSWWRLRWEPAPAFARPGLGWRMAHELPAAGEGFIWPRLTLEGDGEGVLARCRPSRSRQREPLRYVSYFDERVPAADFERGVDDFIGLVLERLAELGARDGGGLRDLWGEVGAERADPAASQYRTFEALLGHDPDEAPEALVAELVALADRAGGQTAVELAAACAGPHPARGLSAFAGLAASHDGVAGRPMQDAPDLLPVAERPSASDLPPPPWELGRRVASGTRDMLNLPPDRPLPDDSLAALLGIAPSALQAGSSPAAGAGFGVGVRVAGDEGVRLLFRRRARSGRRFEAARFVYDALRAAPDQWLFTSDTKTARQRAQRSFAAELLHPIAGLDAFLQGDFSPSATDRAARHYVSGPLTIRSQLANHGRIERDQIAAAA